MTKARTAEDLAVYLVNACTAYPLSLEQITQAIEAYGRNTHNTAVEQCAHYMENHAQAYGISGHTTVKVEDETIQSDRFIWAQKLRDLKQL